MSHMSERVDLTLTEKLGLNDAYIPRIDVPVSEVTLWRGDERDIPSARYFGRVSTRAGEEKIVTAEVVVPVRDERLRGALGRDALHVASLTAEGVVFYMFYRRKILALSYLFYILKTPFFLYTIRS